jgi:hypothetical protein
MSEIKTLNSVAGQIDTHEQVCAERYKRIEERLDSGQKKFSRLENMLWGVYLLMISSTVLSNFMQ